MGSSDERRRSGKLGANDGGHRQRIQGRPQLVALSSNIGSYAPARCACCRDRLRSRPYPPTLKLLLGAPDHTPALPISAQKHTPLGTTKEY